MLDVLRSGRSRAGARVPALRGGIRRHRRHRPCGRLLERDGRPARQPGATGRGPGRRGDHLVVLVRRVGQRDPVPARDAGVRRHRRADVQRRPRGGRGGHHAAHEGDPPGAHLRLPVRHRRDQRDRGAPRPAGGRGRLRGAGRERGRPAGGRLRQPRGLRVLPEQADHHRRGRNDHDRRPRRRAGAAQHRQPGALGQRRLAGAPAARVQLQDGRDVRGRGACPAGEAGVHAGRAGAGGPPLRAAAGRRRGRGAALRGAPSRAAGSSTTYGWPSTSTARR